MIVYNLFPLLAGPCGNWEPHLERAASMGFDWVFVNPVQKTGYSGSLYSIVDYFQLNPLFVDAQSPLSSEQQMQAATASAESLFTKSEDLSYTRRYIQFLEGMAWGMERTSATRNGRFWRLFWSRGKRGVRASML